ncbi:hypothetical protein JOD43_000153 [Pullulanibacillus pueri]|uniref:SEC-C motif-containing protein n=1 Tax=Pullulanibacillus pueri TaxID=1437324 RepID=A0A8J3EJ12_9BACL|nr:SEC-C domain-containing protein [Pullulanibacillus pueri]MBM7679994.1 hypothetical protein [Pullulanibacillus pueri]GGH73840.1 hypothetical protein GCM10007096_01480 [Pullulanibacillus pueri]
MNIGRNDPCPCGSGKKYKKCCMNKVETLEKGQERILFKEYERVLQDLFNYARKNYENELSAPLRDFFTDAEVDDTFIKNHSFFLILWEIFNQPLQTETKETIFDHYLELYLEKQKRTSAQKMVQGWKETSFSTYRVLNISTEEENMVVEDAWTGTTYTTFLPDSLPEPSSLLIGQLVAIGQRYEFFGGYFELQEYTQAELDAVRAAHFPNGTEQEKAIAFKNAFPTLLLMLATKNDREASPLEEKSVAIGAMTEEQKQVYALFIEKHDLALEPKTLDIVAKLWHHYVKEEFPQVKKPELYAAALEYLAANLSSQYATTQSALSKKYGASASSISQKYRSLNDFHERSAVVSG